MLEELRLISAASLGSFEAFAKWHINLSRTNVPSEAQELAVMSALLLDPTQKNLLNDIWRTYHLGIPSANHLVNIFVSALCFDNIREVMDRYNGIVEQKEIIDAYELGVNICEDTLRYKAARKYIDATIGMYCALYSTYGEEDQNTCIAFPGKPDMNPMLSAVIETANTHLKYGDLIVATMSRYNDPEPIYSYPIYGSDNRQPVILTNAGSIYLFTKPPRNDTAAKFLKVVRNNDE